MTRYWLPLALLLSVASFCARAQSSDPVPAKQPEKDGTYLGVLFSAVPEVLYDHLPTLPRHGVLVTHVLPGSPADEAELRRHDVLLFYDDQKIKDCEHFARLVHDDTPGRPVKLRLVRGGKEKTVALKLAKGPVLKIAQDGQADKDRDEVPRAAAKANGLAPVSVSAAPLGGGNMKVIVEYYQEGTGKLHTMTCSGGPEEIDRKVEDLPDKVQELVKVALKRFRSLDIQKKEPDLPNPRRKDT